MLEVGYSFGRHCVWCGEIRRKEANGSGSANEKVIKSVSAFWLMDGREDESVNKTMDGVESETADVRGMDS